MNKISEQLDELISLSEQIVENTTPERKRMGPTPEQRARVEAQRIANEKVRMTGIRHSYPHRMGRDDAALSISTLTSKLDTEQLDSEFDRLRPAVDQTIEDAQDAQEHANLERMGVEKKEELEQVIERAKAKAKGVKGRRRHFRYTTLLDQHGATQEKKVEELTMKHERQRQQKRGELMIKLEQQKRGGRKKKSRRTNKKKKGTRRKKRKTNRKTNRSKRRVNRKT